MSAVDAGVRQVQGTINGLGERCGNANLISLIPTLVLKTDYLINIDRNKLKSLTKLSKLVDNLLNISSKKQSAYVGDYAFSHKGGLHASAIEKNPTTYEHINPELVGNERNVIISNQAGRSNLLNQLKKMSIQLSDEKLNDILRIIKERESAGFSYDTAIASFEILVRKELDQIKDFYSLQKFRVTSERRWNAKGLLITESEATINITISNEVEDKMTVGVGNGPVEAIDSALKKALISFSMNRFYQGDWIDSMASRFIEELPEKHLEKNSFFENNEIEEDDFDFNQDFEVKEGTKSPGWIRYQKRIK